MYEWEATIGHLKTSLQKSGLYFAMTRDFFVMSDSPYDHLSCTRGSRRITRATQRTGKTETLKTFSRFHSSHILCACIAESRIFLCIMVPSFSPQKFYRGSCPLGEAYFLSDVKRAPLLIERCQLTIKAISHSACLYRRTAPQQTSTHDCEV